MAVFKKGDLVKLKVAVPEGPVVAMRMDEDGEVHYLVQWADGDDGVHQRWFAEAELTGV